MQARIFSIFSVLILYLVIGCSSSTGSTEEEQEEPPQLPTASFNVEGDLFTGGEVSFNNTSSDADSYTWKFGGSTTANESNPTKTFSDYGDITVTLTAENSDGEDTASKTINIEPNKLFIKKLEVDDFPFTNNEGSSWDVSSGPDVYAILSNDSSEGYKLGSSATDVSKSDLPISWSYEEPGLELGRTDFETSFIFGLSDEDQTNDNDPITTIPSDYFTIKNRWLENTPESVTLETSESVITLTLGWE